MDKKENIREVKYRIGLLQIEALLENGTITEEQYRELKILLVKKYEPMIGGLEFDE
ncbi:hypothetical protein LJC17_03140 [Acholeplasma sp. OttesenSCG-928-E16]|nr:hypothetical protein [Acholeplasma sp. OttesenSCG-928-E16]